MNIKFYKNLFLVAAIYDLLLGFCFVIFYQSIYIFFNIPLPNYPQYIQLSAAFVAAMGVGYYFVYKNISRNTDIVRLGIVYKGVYSGLVTYYYLSNTAHLIFFLLAIIDFIFLLFFVRYLSNIKRIK